MRHAFLGSLVLLLASTLACSAEDALPEPIPGLGPVGKVTKVHGDFMFTEGPAADGKGNLYFSDIPANKIYKLDAQGKLSVAVETSNHANGLMFNAAGELVACEMDGQIAVWDLAKKERRVLAAGYNGKRFNAPNDLVIDSAGGVYFTDPHFRAPEPLPQGKTSVYYVASDGKVSRVIEELPAPNGILLSPDEKTLYVLPTLSAKMMAYPVLGEGKLGEGKVFVTLQQPAGKANTGADGATIDEKGNLYITSALGLQVFSPAGNALGIIAFPEQPANATFGGKDGKTLYATARTSLYSVPMAVAGHVVARGK
jgi:gluconolactonase